MGIRSLLRNAFGRSKAARNESPDARKNTDKPEAVTIPEAREESTPAPVVPPTAPPEAEVPAARTAPAEPAPAAAPKTASLPAQSSPVDRAPEPAAKAAAPAATETPVRDEPTAVREAPKPAADATAPKDEAAAKDLDEPRPGAEAGAPVAPDSAADLVSQAFDNPATTAEGDSEPKPAAQPEQEKEEQKETVAAAVTPQKVVDEAPAAADEAAEAPTPAAAPDAQAAEPADEAPAPANPVAATAPALLPLHEAARATLEKHGLAAQRATVYLVLDRSGSMRNYYKDGTVQHLAEQALGLSVHLDEQATVPVVFFSTDVDGTADLDLATYEDRIDELHSGLGHMGRTNYHWAIEAVVTHYKKSGSTDPAFVIFQTDGAPTSKPAAERALCQAAQLPIFWQFIGFGDPDAKGFDFLRKLDDLTIPEKRVVDNAGFFHAGRDPRSLSHEELYQQLMVEFPEWLAEARAAKVLKDS
ncbi:vWA domain-containing protein [Streptomyces sp. WZ-12]|uniref:vWA domain-containing protein n=1 Tax=Streptomyces sp. WZ-12 TaxID=3030210 RepID=UPI00238161CF|nr:VWA domain-containing protein [Streptomyces sp. WZ-12]